MLFKGLALNYSHYKATQATDLYPCFGENVSNTLVLYKKNPE